MAIGQNGRRGMLAVASTEGFKHVAPQAALLLKGLRLP
jgi:hypothetical protein